MITRSHRFHGYGSLRFIYRNGKTVRGPLCSLKYIRNTRRKTYRLSVVVNKKVNKSDTFLSFDNNDMSKTILYSILDS